MVESMLCYIFFKNKGFWENSGLSREYKTAHRRPNRTRGSARNRVRNLCPPGLLIHNTRLALLWNQV